MFTAKKVVVKKPLIEICHSWDILFVVNALKKSLKKKENENPQTIYMQDELQHLCKTKASVQSLSQREHVILFQQTCCSFRKFKNDKDGKMKLAEEMLIIEGRFKILEERIERIMNILDKMLKGGLK